LSHKSSTPWPNYVEFNFPGRPPTIPQPMNSWNAFTGRVERFHRTLKAPIMCHADQRWTEALPLVLLEIRTAFKADLQVSVAELVYGEPLRIPGELLTPTADPVDPAHLIIQLHQHMARLRPVPAVRHASPATFVHKDLHNCTHVLLCQDATRRALEPPYSGPYQVLSRKEKTLQVLVHGKPVTVSADRVKPAYVLNETDCGSTTSKSSANTTPATPHTISGHTATTPSYPDYTIRSPRPLPCTFRHLSNNLRGGVMWESPTKQFCSENQQNRPFSGPPLTCSRATTA
jgi:hypothetical protein